MRYLSVCSGIEAATVAWHPLGWTPAAFSEIEAFPRAVLAHHYPNVPLHGDFTTIKGDEYGAVDLLVGGTPCQSFSVAGLRKGLDDPRGNLMLEYGALAKRLGAKWLVWENVPGVLSSNGGWDFAAFLRMLAELGYGFAYRVLDAQYSGVPQRRRRVFVVACLGDWRAAAAVLFERHSLQGHPAPSREEGQAVAGTLSSRTTGGGGLGTDFELGGGSSQSPALACNHEAPIACYPAVDVCPTLRAGGNKTGGDRPPGTDVDTCDSLLIQPALSVALRGRDGGATAELGGEVAGTLRAGGGGGGDKAHVLAPIAFSCKDYGNSRPRADLAPTMRSMGHAASHPNGGGQLAVAFAIQAGALRTNPLSGPDGMGVQEGHAYTLEARAEVQAVCFAQNTRDEVREMPYAGALAAQPGMKQTSYLREGMAVRRLTPRECERLQGFPDDYTLVPHRNKPAADGPRYKALGNSMAVPCMRWIGERIQAVVDIKSQREAA